MRKNQLFINVDGHWSEIDLFEDTTIPITLKCTEVKNFASRNTGYSVEFNIPHTNNNAKTLGLVADINIYRGSFEVGKDYPAYITNGGITTFDGQFRLKRVIKQNSGNYIYYVGNMFGGTKNFVDALGNKALIGNQNTNDDLDFSEYDTPGEEMMLGDFVGYLQNHYTDGTGWGLTLLDKTNKAAQAFSHGSQTWYTDECTPYLYAREIFDKLFTNSGYTYVSEFLQGTDFSSYLQDPRWANGIGKYDVNSLIYPYMRHNSNIQVLNKASSVIFQSNSNAQTDLVSGSSPSLEKMWFEVYNGTYAPRNWTLNFDTNNYIIQNNLANPTLTAWKFVVPRTGIYNMKFNIPVYIRTQWYCDATGNLLSGRDTVTAVRPENTFSYQMTLMKNGRAIHTIYDTRTYRHETPGGTSDTFTLDNAGYTHLTEDLSFDYNNNVYLSNGDIIEVYCWVQLQQWENVWFPDQEEYRSRPSLGYTGHYIDVPWSHYPQLAPVRPVNLSFHVPSAADDVIISLSQQDGFYEGNPFYPNEILNPKTTKIDFFNNFIKMFNLYVEDVSGKKNYKTGGVYPPNTLRIEPYEIFYAPELGQGQSNIKDWTSKIDWSTVEYRRCDDYLYNIQNFTKEQDGDFYNSNYNSTYKLPYGNREVVGEYCTKDDKNNIELKVSSNLCGIVNNSTDTLQCPKVFSLDNSGNIDTKKEYSDGIFFIWRNYMNLNTDLGTNYTIKLQSRLSSSYQNVTNYYCADTLNKGYGADDANLNWGETSTYYQNMKGTIPTYNDLFNAFYAKEYAEKTAQDAIIIKAKAYLTQLDINTVQLSDAIVINGDYYHILEINQWEDADKPCEIELIKTRPNFPVDVPNSKNITTLPQNQLPITVDTASLVQQINALQSEIAELK